jgi:hypothetical protein
MATIRAYGRDGRPMLSSHSAPTVPPTRGGAGPSARPSTPWPNESLPAVDQKSFGCRAAASSAYEFVVGPVGIEPTTSRL